MPTLALASTRILLEDVGFLVLSSLFLGIVGWAWRNAKPFELPQPLPAWFRVWFLAVQVGGVVPPLVVLLRWGIGQGDSEVRVIFLSYFIVLALQILAEILTLRQLRSVVWVMVPYLYLPYRIWQLSEGIKILNANNDLVWVITILWFEILLWTLNYCLDLSQLPRLLRWEMQSSVDQS